MMCNKPKNIFPNTVNKSIEKQILVMKLNIMNLNADDGESVEYGCGEFNRSDPSHRLLLLDDADYSYLHRLANLTAGDDDGNFGDAANEGEADECGEYVCFCTFDNCLTPPVYYFTSATGTFGAPVWVSVVVAVAFGYRRYIRRHLAQRIA